MHARALAVRKDWRGLLEQARAHRSAKAVIVDPSAYEEGQASFRPYGIECRQGTEGIQAIIREDALDMVLLAASGSAGLPVALTALDAGKTLALANKEPLVMAGPVLTRLAKERGAAVVPIDSEHSAIFQALRAGKRSELRRVILTASGGPFLGREPGTLDDVTPEEALRHPNWKMGRKITVDSATLMNKALELVEALWLFDLDPTQLEVVIHPQSLVHSIVEFCDGSMLAQMGPADMRIPIQYALTYPDRAPASTDLFLSMNERRDLVFLPADPEKFPALQLGFRAMRQGGTLPAVMNAANEEAVALFLAGRIRFPDIVRLVRSVMDRHQVAGTPDLPEILAADRWARQEASQWSNG